MLKYGNREIRNLQEQVLENMKDIANLKEGTAVLSEFGIKVVGEVETIADLPTVLEYKSEHEDWAYGDAYAVGTTSPYTLYILTRANDTHEDDYWFDIGVFPVPGPQGEQGPRGETGPQGQTGATGEQGASAGFGTITATAETLSPGSAATATVVASGPDTAKELSFTFGLPQGESAAFTHYVTITASTIVGGQYTGTLTLTQYNTLYDNYDSVVRLRSSSSLANNYYFLKKWYTSDDYIVFLGVWSLNNNDTRYYLLKIDRSNRRWTLDVGLPIKITSYNINSTSATIGQVLTADGSGGASWQDAAAGSDVVTLTTTVGNLSNDDYNKVAGNNCVIIYDDNTTKVYFKKYDETSTTITYATPYSEGSSTYVYGVGITKATKYYQIQSAYMPISNSNIKSGSTIADKYLKTNGSGGAVWGDAPSQVQSDWNESSSSSPAYIKNKPTIPTVPVTDVTVNGTSVMDGTTAKVVVDTVDGATDGTNWTSLTINGTTAGIPAAQVNSDWNAASGVAQILNKPTLATVATSGSYADLSNKPTIPDAVSGTNDGTNWTSLTIGSDTYGIGGGSAPSNMVTTDTAQTITGVKTFNNNIKLQHGKLLYLDDGEQVSNSYLRHWSGTARIIIDDPSTTENPEFEGSIDGALKIECGGTTGPGWKFDKKSLYNSNSSITHNLGTSANKFNNLYLSGDITDGTNSISVANMVGKSTVSGTYNGTDWTSLTVDGVTKQIPSGGGGGGTATDVQINGTSIVSNNVANIATEGTYNATTNKIATMSELANCVTLSGAQTITGAKTFKNQDGLNIYDVNERAYLNAWENSDNTSYLDMHYTNRSYVNYNDLIIRSYDDIMGSGVHEFKFHTSRSTAPYFAPNKNADTIGYDLGTSTNRWNDLYLRGNLSDGTNSISVANIVGKSTVSGTNDGTNWTSLTVDGNTYSIPAGGGSPKYLHHMTLVIKPSSSDNYMTSFDYISTSNTSLAEHGTAGNLSSTMKDILTALNSYGTQAFDQEGITPAIQLNNQYYPSYLYYREGFGFYYIVPSLNSSGVATYQATALGSSTSPYDITDNVQTL